MGMFDPKKRKTCNCDHCCYSCSGNGSSCCPLSSSVGKKKMRLGKAAMEALQAEISGLLTPGNELVVAGAIALYGTAQIAKGKT